MKRRTSLAAVAVSALLFGTLAVLTPLAYDRGALPLPLLTWRFVIAAVLLFVFAGVTKPASLRIPPSDIARYAALGLTGYGLASICFFFALRYAPSGVVAVLLYTYPALVTVAGWVFEGKKASKGQLLAVAITFAGIVLVVDPFHASGSVQWQGIVLGLGAAVGYTAFNLLSARWLHGRSRLVMMAWTFAFGALLAAGVAVAMGTSLSAADWQPSVWALLLAIVALPTFGAVVLYLEGIRGLGASQAALISTLEPLFTIALAWAVLGQKLTAIQWAGAALVLIGVVLAETSARIDADKLAAV